MTVLLLFPVWGRPGCSLQRQGHAQTGSTATTPSPGQGAQHLDTPGWGLRGALRVPAPLLPPWQIAWNRWQNPRTSSLGGTPEPRWSQSLPSALSSERNVWLLSYGLLKLDGIQTFSCPVDSNFLYPLCVVCGSNAWTKTFLVWKRYEHCQGNSKAFQIIML